MRDLTRRGFLASAAALPVLGMGGDTTAGTAATAATPSMPATDVPGAPGAPGAQTNLDPVLLRALATVALPNELGEVGTERAVVGFERWVGAYEPAAEANHGYGTDEIDYLPPDPAPGWNAQLRALDAEANRRHATGFAALDPARRDELVRRHIGDDRNGGLPSPLRARHVAVGLLAWWAATPEANDLCYRARIGRETCRPLSSAGDPPAPLGA